MKVIHYAVYHHISSYAPDSLWTKIMNNFASKHLLWLTKICRGIIIKHGLEKTWSWASDKHAVDGQNPALARANNKHKSRSPSYSIDAGFCHKLPTFNNNNNNNNKNNNNKNNNKNKNNNNNKNKNKNKNKNNNNNSNGYFNKTKTVKPDVPLS